MKAPEQDAQTFNDPVSALVNYLMYFLSLVPGREIIMRYVASSYQNDPIRSLLELILFIFAVRTVLQNRTRSGQNTNNFVQLDQKVCAILTLGNRLFGQRFPAGPAL